MRRILLAAALVLAACGGGDDDGGGEKAAATTTTSVADAAEADDSPTTTAGEESPAEPTSSTAAPAPDGATPTTAAVVAASEGPAPLAPGTYHYRQSGEIKAGPQAYPIPPEGTAEVEPATAEPTQLIRRYVDPEQSPVETRLRYDRTGILLYETAGGQGPTGFRCAFDPPLQLVAWPPTVGHTGSGSADCDNVSITYEIRITGRTPVTIDGASYDAYVLESTIETTGDLESTSRQVDHFVAELRMSTHTETDIEGTFQGFAFTGHTVADLVSAVPD